MTYVEKSEPMFSAINIGTGSGASVFEVLAMIEKASGIQLDPIRQDRRAGDPAELVANVSRAKTVLNWSSRRDLAETVESAWSAWQRKIK
jgi:UDP-glucose 4-epimerase